MHAPARLRTTAIVILFLFASIPAAAQPLAEGELPPARELPGFEENRGQLADQHGLPRPDIRYSFVSGPFRMRLLRSSLSYELVRHERPARESGDDRDPFDRFENDRQPTTVYVHRVDVSFPGANPMPVLESDGMLPGYNNYYYGHMSEAGATFVRSWSSVRYRDLYAGTDLRVYTNSESAISKFPVKYDFILRPGADPSDIRIRYEGATALRLTAGGALEIVTSEGTITEHSPECWAVLADGSRRAVSGAFRVEGDEVSFVLGDYPAEATLVIDPGLVWATYYGGSDDDYFNLVRAGQFGSVFAAGTTLSSSGIAIIGAAVAAYQGGYDAFLVKFQPNGVRHWGTYYGGSDDDYGDALAVSPSGAVCLGGRTYSQSGIATSGMWRSSAQGQQDGFIARFDSAGVRQFGTYIGGSLPDGISSLALVGTTGILFAGYARSLSGVATPSAYQTALAGNLDGMVGQLAWNGAGMAWCTYYGGASVDDFYTVTVDGSGNVIVAGETSSTGGIASPGAHLTTLNASPAAMLVKFNGAGSRLWGTYVGGSNDTYIYANATDAGGAIYVGGMTYSPTGIGTSGTHQPSITSQGAPDAMLMKFTSSGALAWGTYFGGDSFERIMDIALLGSSAYVAGNSASTSGISTPHTYQESYGGLTDGIIARFNTSNGTLSWSTYFGGAEPDYLSSIAVQSSALLNLVVAGGSESPGLATANSHQTAPSGTDGLLAVFRDVTVTPGTITRTTVCTNDQLAVPFVIAGTFDTGNKFSVELSDASGSFANPDTIGVLNATTAGTVTCTVPGGTPIGTGYKVRIVSSRPPVTSPPAVQTLTIRDGEPHTLVWTGAISTNWIAVGNWDNGCAAPSDSDAVIIPPGTTPPASIPALRLSSLVLDNSAGTQLAGNLQIVDSLVLMRGTLRLGDYNLTLGPAAVLADASDSSFIVTNGSGELRQQSIGSGAPRDMALFPVGANTGSYTPLFLQNAGASDEFRVRVDSIVTMNGQIAGTPIAWNVVGRSWRASEATAGGSDLTITVDWNTAQELPGFDRGACFIARLDPAGWLPLGSAKQAAGMDPWSSTARSVDVLGTLVVGDTLSYVPVELLSFTVREAGGLALLEWTTAWETNNFGFEVQRATTDGDFDVIAFVPAGSAQGSRYTFADAPPAAGIWRYRLRQVDTDGSDSHSPEVRMTIDARPDHTALLTAWPNPARDLVTVRAGATPMGDLVLRDLLGRELRRVRASVLTDLPLVGLPAGLYHIEAITDAGVGTLMLRVLR